MIPLIAAAIAAGVVRTGAGIIQNRKETRRKRGLIQEAYRNSADRLDTRQRGVREGENESLNARGLLQGGQEDITASSELNSTDANVTRPGDEGSRAITRAPRTLAGQTQSDTEHELGMEWRDLDTQRRMGEADLKAASNQRTANDIAGGIQTGASVFNAGKTMQAGGAIASAMGSGALDSLPTDMPGVSQLGNGKGRLSPIQAAMTGVEDAGNWFAGVSGLDPLGAPGSSWNRKEQGTILGSGQSNAEFHV